MQPAAADPRSGSEYAYAGSGSQFGSWSQPLIKLGLAVYPTSNMSTDRCMDAMLDWDTRGTGHYDSRVVRSCRPGTSEQTDPGGDGYWQEDSGDWDQRSITGVQKGFGYMLLPAMQIAGQERFPGSGTADLYRDPPGTGTQGWARVRTRYQDGTVKSCNPLPATSSSGSGGCS